MQGKFTPAYHIRVYMEERACEGPTHIRALAMVTTLEQFVKVSPP